MLVTGGAGFIGSHLVDRLLAEGHEVCALDDLSTGRRANLVALGSEPRLTFVEADVVDHATVVRCCAGIDTVFHLAALADIVPSIQRPLDYHRANVDGTASVVEAARQAGVRRLVYAASSSCYGIPDRYPTSEDAEVRPQYPYALSKYLGEEIVLRWGRFYRLPVVSLRLFNVYGPRARTTGAYGAVFGVFLAQLLARKPLTVVGDGSQTRDFTYVTDVVDAFVRAADGDAVGEIMNVGRGRSESVNRLVELLGNPPVVHVPKRPGEPDCTRADTARIRRVLGWEPRVSFEEGVERMLAAIDHWRDAPVWDVASIASATREWFAHLGPSAGAS